MFNIGVVALDGLLYVLDSNNGTSASGFAEFYDPNNNTWTMVEAPVNHPRGFPGVVTIEKPQYF